MEKTEESLQRQKVYVERFLNRLTEIYQSIQGNESLSRDILQGNFSDGTKMRKWLHNNKVQIERYSKKGNVMASAVLDYIKNYKKSCFLRRLEETYNYLQKNANLPKLSSSSTFNDGSKMGWWLHYNRVQIERYSKNGNIMATAIVHYLDSCNQATKTRTLYESKLIEIYEYIKQYNKIPDKNSEVLFSNGGYMGKWLYINYQSINRYSQQGNVYAKKVIDIILLVNSGPLRYKSRNIRADKVFNEPKSNEKVSSSSKVYTKRINYNDSL